MKDCAVKKVGTTPEGRCPPDSIWIHTNMHMHLHTCVHPIYKHAYTSKGCLLLSFSPVSLKGKTVSLFCVVREFVSLSASVSTWCHKLGKPGVCGSLFLSKPMGSFVNGLLPSRVPGRWKTTTQRETEETCVLISILLIKSAVFSHGNPTLRNWWELNPLPNAQPLIFWGWMCTLYKFTTWMLKRINSIQTRVVLLHEASVWVTYVWRCVFTMWECAYACPVLCIAFCGWLSGSWRPCCSRH